MYRWNGAALLRASTDPGGLELPDDPTLSFDANGNGLAWLSSLWQRADVRGALGVASPALVRQVDKLVAGTANGDREDARAIRRAVLAVASYLLRWQRRPTPFGLFAGVAAARAGANASVRWGNEHRTTVRADTAWLGDVLRQLHSCQQLRARLSVVANDAGAVRGARFVAPGPTPDGHATESVAELAPIEVSIRHSRPVRAAVTAAREPVRVSELHALLLDEFPAAADRIDDLIAGLLANGLLICNLWAPMTCPDPLGHACAQLTAADANAIPEIRDTVRELLAIHRELRAATAPKATVIERMRTLSETTRLPLVVDTMVDCEVQLPEQVARDAEDAVDVLFRLSPYPWGYPAWRDYHDRFRARYGTGALVPLLTLVADSGLGFPADYLGSAFGRTARKVSERDETLLALIQRATLDGGGEILLTDQVIKDLTSGDREDIVDLPARVEVAVELRAESVAALNRGRFALTVTGTPRPGSSMAGRHAQLLPADVRDLIAESLAATGPAAIAAQLSFAPRKRRNENISRTEQLLPHVIPVAEYREPHERLLRLADLGVTADDHRFHLVHTATGRRVEPRVPHALEAGVHTPPLARFLAEITTARCGVYQAFHFGAAARLPYLPRIRFRRTTLSPARWLLTASDLPGRTASAAEWAAGLDLWRDRWRVPEHVAVVEHDRRQPVDLRHRLHRWLLRTRLERAGRLELRETAAPAELGWLGRAHELLLPLVMNPDARPGTAPPRAVEHEPPGNSTILCAQLYGHPGRFDEILTEHLPGLLDTVDGWAVRWWFRRHRELRRPEADQYLAVYLPTPAAYGEAAERITAWADRLRADRLLARLTLTTNEPQPGRYGHGGALERAQQVFTADSAAALSQISWVATVDVSAQALVAASLVDLAVRFAGSARAGLGWLVDELPREYGRLDPALRARTLELADPHGTWTTLRSLPGGDDVLAAWDARGVALTAYRESLAPQRDPLTVLRSMLHLHHGRAVPVEPERERVTLRLARTVALQHTARQEG
ncbi:lantibiotic dehydratase [Actinophytocola sediminis]